MDQEISQDLSNRVKNVYRQLMNGSVIEYYHQYTDGDGASCILPDNYPVLEKMVSEGYLQKIVIQEEERVESEWRRECYSLTYKGIRNYLDSRGATNDRELRTELLAAKIELERFCRSIFSARKSHVEIPDKLVVTIPRVRAYIAYRHTDQNIANNFARLMSERNIYYFWDYQHLRLEKDILDQINAYLDYSTHLFAIVTDSSKNSWWLPYEISSSVLNDKEILIYSNLPDSEIPEYLREYKLIKDINEIQYYLDKLSTTGNRFRKTDYGSIVDTRTSFEWVQGADVYTDWSMAVNFIENLSSGGHTDWRFPFIHELHDLYDEKAGGGCFGNMDKIFNLIKASCIWGYQRMENTWGYHVDHLEKWAYNYSTRSYGTICTPEMTRVFGVRDVSQRKVTRGVSLITHA